MHKGMVWVGGLLGLSAAASAQSPTGRLPPSSVPGSPPGFNYPLSFDSTTADPKNHHVVYQDSHIRVLEVTLWPHDKELMHGHAYPSVFAIDDIQPRMENEHLEPGPVPRTGPNAPIGVRSTAPGGPAFPYCNTMVPQSPHAVTITQDFPQHFFRIEFKHLDPANFAAHWKQIYPQWRMPAPHRAAVQVSAPVFSAAWPYSIGYETSRAAPDIYRVLFEDSHLRLLEVLLLPGQTTPMFGSPYFAVNAYDVPQPGTPGGATLSEHPAAPAALGGTSAPPRLGLAPTCTITGPIPPHQITNTGTVPLHYYRFEYLRLDGEGFAANWRVWYPRMPEGPDLAAR